MHRFLTTVSIRRWVTRIGVTVVSLYALYMSFNDLKDLFRTYETVPATPTVKLSRLSNDDPKNDLDYKQGHQIDEQQGQQENGEQTKPKLPGGERENVQQPVKETFTKDSGDYHIEDKFVDEHSYTVVILSYDRDKILRDTVSHYALMRNASLVFVLWSNQEKPPPRIDQKSEWKAKVIVERLPANNLTLRFKYRKEIVTSAIFTTDDDMRIHERDMERAFEAWKSNPRKLVGFYARKHVPGKGKGRWVYALVERPKKEGYSMVLTGACFYHRNYMHVYFTAQPPVLLSLIDEWRNCEDIAMNFMVSRIYPGSSGLYVHPHRKIVHTSFGFDEHHHWRPQGLSGRKKHHGQRALCVTEFFKIYGSMPLVMTHEVWNN